MRIVALRVLCVVACADGLTAGAETLFEIGSITKVFTALILADMVDRAEVRFDDPITRTPATGRRTCMPSWPDMRWRAIPAPVGSTRISAPAADMLTFAAAALGGDTPLRAAFARMTLRRPRGQPATQQLAGWVGRSGQRARTAGPRRRDPGIPGVADDRPGRPPRGDRVVTREGSRLFVQATGQPRFEVHAERRDAFFLTAVDAQLTFTRDADGAVTGLVLHQNGASRPAPRRP